MNYQSTSYRFCLKLLVVIGLMIIYPFTLFTSVYATDCNAKCEEHFDKWYQETDLLRCQAEREVACQWGIEHCDLYKPEPNRILITEVIQWSHDNTNYPADEAQCYDTINLGNTVYSAGSKTYDAYKLATGTVAKFNPYAILAVEMVKQVLRCSCEEVQWSPVPSGGQPSAPTINYSKTLYVDSTAPANGIGTQAKPFNSISQANTLTQDGALLNLKAGVYAETVELSKKVTLVATGGTVTIGSSGAVTAAAIKQSDITTDSSTTNSLAAAESQDGPLVEMTQPHGVNATMAVYLPIINNTVATQVAESVAVDEVITSRVETVTTDEANSARQRIFLPLINQQ